MKKILSILFIILNVSPTFSQYEEVGLFFGTNIFLGDVYSDVSNNLEMDVGAHYRHNFDTRWAWRTDFRYGRISGDDINAMDSFRQQRNLSFYSNVLQAKTTVEFNFMKYRPYKPQSFFRDADVFTPFAFVGIGLIYHNPKAVLAGNEYELRPLQTEGVSYSKIALTMPFGFGFKFRLTDRFMCELRGELTPTFTDYLDDVSTRYPRYPDSLSKTARDLSNRSKIAQGTQGSSWGTQRGNEYNRDWLGSLVVSLNFNLNKNPGTCHYKSNN